jgi:hypothetical protein
MKHLFILPAFLFCCIAAAAQTKPLPDCATMKETLISVQRSLSNLGAFKTKKVREKDGRSDYETGINFCGQMGEIEEDEKKIRLEFGFSSYDYKGTVEEFEVLAAKIFAAVNDVFGKDYAHEESVDFEAAVIKSKNFFEKEKTFYTSKTTIRIVTFIDESYSADLRFEFRK